MEYAVVTQGLSRKFGDIEAVDSIDLRIPRGEIYGFLGPNGAGKTTLVRMLITLLLPSECSASVAGYDIVRQANDIRLRIGAALQDAALDLKQTGRELLRLQGRFYGLSRRAVDTRFNDLADLIDIGDAVDRLIGTYSGGMKRRLDLAAALIHDPEVLFLDEPTTGLDPISRARVWEEVRADHMAVQNVPLGRERLSDHAADLPLVPASSAAVGRSMSAGHRCWFRSAMYCWQNRHPPGLTGDGSLTRRPYSHDTQTSSRPHEQSLTVNLASPTC